MRFKVPQNIDMPDRILGPLTMVQFVYGVIGIGTCYVVYMSLPKPLNYMVALPIAVFTFCVVLVKVNERPFLIFLSAAIQFFMAPKQRLWHQGSDQDMKVEVYHPKSDTGPKVASKEVSREQMENLAHILDSETKR